MTIEIRDECAADIDTVRAINDAAFGQATEGAILDALRANCANLVSLVAVENDTVVGHILFSPTVLKLSDGSAEIDGMGLAPMAVLPAYQNAGVGSALVRAGMTRVQAEGAPYVVVLGHPEFYPRFGFERASLYGVRCPWDVPDDVFMIHVFDGWTLPKSGGVAYYRGEFDAAI